MSREVAESPRTPAIFDLTGRRALVTGASRGIGRALALGLADFGAEVMCIARSGELLEETVAEIDRRGGGRAVSHAQDLRGEDGAKEAIEATVDRLGGIDILVNNAADDHESSVLETDLATWQRVIELNLESVFLLCRTAGPHLQRSGRGKVINVGSILAAVGVRDDAAYISAKHGLVGLTRALALEWARQGVQVNAIGPGFVRTEMTQPVWSSEAGSAWVLKQTPIGRWGEPDDLVGTAVLLASSASDFMTGQIVYVDGGWLAQ